LAEQARRDVADATWGKADDKAYRPRRIGQCPCNSRHSRKRGSYEASYLNGVGVPRNTSNEIIERLNGEINAALADPNVRARLADLGGTPLLLSPDDFGKLIADETTKWAKVVKFAGIKAD
jgi:hypothetical protein